MKATHKLPVVSKCPHGATDTYVMTVETDRTVCVEKIHEAVAKATAKPVYQEELADALALALDCKVTLVGWHSGVKTTTTAGEATDVCERGSR